MKKINYLKVLLVSVIFFGMQLQSIAQQKETIAKLTKELTEYGTIFKKDFAKARTYFSDDAVFQWPDGSTLGQDGKALTSDGFIAWRKSVQDWAKEETEITAIKVDGNESIVFGIWNATVIKNEAYPDSQDPAQVGKKSTVPFVQHYTWENNKVVRLEMYWDMNKINQDLGNATQ